MNADKGFFGDCTGQTAIEYVLVIGGSLLVAALVAYIVRTQVVGPTGGRAEQNASAIKQVIKNTSRLY